MLKELFKNTFKYMEGLDKGSTRRHIWHFPPGDLFKQGRESFYYLRHPLI